MHRSFHIYTASQDCKTLFPQNYNGEQNIQLAEEVHLEGKWLCGLVEFQLSATPAEPVYVCCDLVKESTTGSFNIPILRQIVQKTTQFAQVAYIPLKQNNFQSLKVFVRTLTNQPLPQAHGINQGESYCTLHFCKDV